MDESRGRTQHPGEGETVGNKKMEQQLRSGVATTIISLCSWMKLPLRMASVAEERDWRASPPSSPNLTICVLFLHQRWLVLPGLEECWGWLWSGGIEH